MTLIELLKITGVNISQGIRSVTFSAEGCEKSPVLNLSLDVGDFSFLPERNLISGAETKKQSTALDSIKDAVREVSMTSQSTDDSQQTEDGR